MLLVESLCICKSKISDSLYYAKTRRKEKKKKKNLSIRFKRQAIISELVFLL